MVVLVIRGNIVSVHSDVIVNAANEACLGGGGVDGAIHAAAGPRLVEECRTIPMGPGGVRCPIGEVRVTKGYNLPAKWVIHTVGPDMRDPRFIHNKPLAEKMLASCYIKAIKTAEALGAKSITFPAISTGIFGYSPEEAAQVATRAIKSTKTSILVQLVAFSHDDEVILQDAVDKTFHTFWEEKILSSISRAISRLFHRK